MITVINVFTVDPANQQRLIGILTEATETSVRRVPGFVSAILHCGSDGTKVAMYAQWRTLADYQSMRDDPSARKYFEEALSIATFEPGLYEVVRSLSRAET